jgi:RNA polymerase sigma-70 factor (ECF subfamily)
MNSQVIGAPMRAATQRFAPWPDRAPQQGGSRQPAAGEPIDPAVQLLQYLPRLRAFAMSLGNPPDAADDLVQETVTRAWRHMGSFEPGTNMGAWLFTILRNEFYSGLRKRRREVQDVDGAMAGLLTSPPDQEDHLALQDVGNAISRLSDDYREALLLVGGSDVSYEEAAEICGCAIGTVKSRVHRARTKLALMLATGVSKAAAFSAGLGGLDPGLHPAGAP